MAPCCCATRRQIGPETGLTDVLGQKFVSVAQRSLSSEDCNLIAAK
jgi:hypothetical protein